MYHSQSAPVIHYHPWQGRHPVREVLRDRIHHLIFRLDMADQHAVGHLIESGEFPKVVDLVGHIAAGFHQAHHMGIRQHSRRPAARRKAQPQEAVDLVQHILPVQGGVGDEMVCLRGDLVPDGAHDFLSLNGIRLYVYILVEQGGLQDGLLLQPKPVMAACQGPCPGVVNAGGHILPAVSASKNSHDTPPVCSPKSSKRDIWR